MLNDDRNLTKSNKKLLEKMSKIHIHLKNIVDNSKQHCDFCKIMNLTQKKWEKKKFENSLETYTINGKTYSIDTMPQYLLGTHLLCNDC